MPRVITRAELSNGGESQGVEFKNSLSLYRECFKSLCGMVNSDTGRGTMLFDVKPDGAPVEAEPGELDSIQQKLVQHARGAFDPPLQLSIAERDRLTRRRNRDSHQGPWKCYQCGSLVGMLARVEYKPEGMRKTYECHCGGEYWPAG